jgi:hypothetical protein
MFAPNRHWYTDPRVVRVIEDPSQFDMVCPVSLDVFRDPVKAEDGKTYERHNITQWFASAEQQNLPITSPLTRQTMGKALVVDDAMVSRIAWWHDVTRHYGPDGSPFPRLPTLTSDLHFALDRVPRCNWATLNLPEPVIVVAGGESAGKSTVVERIVGYPILPRDQSTCTKMVLRIELRRGTQELAVISVRDVATGNTVQEERVALDRMCDRVRAVMNAEVDAADVPIVETREIVIRIQQPWAPCVTVIDTPGLVTVDTKSSRAAMTHRLVRAVVARERGRALFILIANIASPLNVTSVMALAEECKIADQAMGIFTHPDCLVEPNADTTVAKIINDRMGARSTAVQLRYGWFLCRSRDPKVTLLNAVRGSREVYRLHAMALDEYNAAARWAEDRAISSDTAARIGIDAARSCVLRFYEAYLAEHWTVPLIRDLRVTAASLVSATSQLGLPIPAHPEYQAPLGVIATRRVAQLALSSEDQPTAQPASMFQALNRSRVLTVLRQSDVDWKTGARMGSVWGMLTELRERGTKMNTAWRAAEKPLETEAIRIAAAEETHFATAVWEFIEALRLLTSDLAEALIVALFEPNRRVVLRPEQLRCGVFDSTFQGATNDEQAVLCKLQRFPQLQELLLEQLSTFFDGAGAKFQDEAGRRAEAVTDVVCVDADPPSTAGTPARCRLAYDPAATTLGNRIYQSWLRHVIEPLECIAGGIAITDATVRESCTEERLGLLTEVATIAECIATLQDVRLRNGFTE